MANVTNAIGTPEEVAIAKGLAPDSPGLAGAPPQKRGGYHVSHQ